MVFFVRGKEWLQCKYGKSVQLEERSGPTVFSLWGSSSTWSFHPQLPRVYVCVYPGCVTLESGTFSPDMLTLGQVDVRGKDQTRCANKRYMHPGPDVEGTFWMIHTWNLQSLCAFITIKLTFNITGRPLHQAFAVWINTLSSSSLHSLLSFVCFREKYISFTSKHVLQIYFIILCLLEVREFA